MSELWIFCEFTATFHKYECVSFFLLTAPEWSQYCERIRKQNGNVPRSIADLAIQYSTTMKADPSEIKITVRKLHEFNSSDCAVITEALGMPPNEDYDKRCSFDDVLANLWKVAQRA